MYPAGEMRSMMMTYCVVEICLPAQRRLSSPRCSAEAAPILTRDGSCLPVSPCPEIRQEKVAVAASKHSKARARKGKVAVAAKNIQKTFSAMSVAGNWSQYLPARTVHVEHFFTPPSLFGQSSPPMFSPRVSVRHLPVPPCQNARQQNLMARYAWTA